MRYWVGKVATKSGKGMCAYFIDTGTAAIYSYLRLHDDSTVAEVHEKNAVSDLANIGAYGFATAAVRALATANHPSRRTANMRAADMRTTKSCERRHPHVAPNPGYGT